MSVKILSAISGSGKSTYCKQFPGGTVVSADYYFETPDGYFFNPGLLGKAHAYCLKQFDIALNRGSVADLIIVDNTNLSGIEIAPYYALAAAFGHEVEIVRFKCDPGLSLKRNIHGLNEKALKGQTYRFNNEIKHFPPYWNVTNHED